MPWLKHVEVPAEEAPNPHPPRPSERHQYDACETCGRPFSSQKPGKRWGNHACYVASPEFARNNAARAAKVSEKKNMATCPNCRTEFHCPPSRARRGGRPRCCSKACGREYFAARFDREVASRAALEEVQGYDEFLSQHELPCLVEGCNWSGKNLSVHMNKAHGIPATQFKERAGFNAKTGVIATAYARYLAQQGCAHLPKDGIEPEKRGGKPGRRWSWRPEGREHYLKARALGEAIEEPEALAPAKRLR